MDLGPPQKPETKAGLSSAEKHIIQSFESIPFDMPIRKVGLILVWRKFKRVSNFNLKPDATDVDLQNTIRSLEKSGLFFNEMEVNGKSNPNSICFFVASSQVDLNLISKIWLGDHLNDPKVYLELGKLYGFPRTAIEAFDQNSKSIREGRESESLLTLDEIDKKLPKNLRKFASFLFSRTNWQQELETIRVWAEQVKLVDPELYSKLSGRE